MLFQILIFPAYMEWISIPFDKMQCFSIIAFGDVGELAKTKLFIFMNKVSPHLILTKIVSLLMHSYRDSYLLLIFTIPVPYIISKHKILKAHLKLFAIIQLKNYDC